MSCTYKNNIRSETAWFKTRILRNRVKSEGFGLNLLPSSLSSSQISTNEDPKFTEWLEKNFGTTELQGVAEEDGQRLLNALKEVISAIDKKTA